MQRSRKWLVLLGLLGLCSLAHTHAQTLLRDRWQKGRVVLSERDTLKGQINYDPDTDILRINVQNTVKTFSPQRVLAFDFYDSQRDEVRTFHTFRYGAYSNYETPVFFETALDGEPLSVLLRETVRLETMPVYDPFMHRSFFGQQMRVVAELYIKNERDKIRKYGGNRRELMNLLRPYQQEIRRYMKANRFKHSNGDHVIRIVRYYNDLASETK